MLDGPANLLLGSTAGDTPLGVNVMRYTTRDFVNWSDPISVLYLPNGSGKLGSSVGDGKVWTMKSMDRNDATGEYLMAASYGAAARMFRAVRPTTPDSFQVTTGDLKTPNFKDHDDVNLYYDPIRAQWVDMQISYEVWNKTYCDNCHGARRYVTYRTSEDGTYWSDDGSCLDNPQKDEHCKKFNTSAMITAIPEVDPPELEFYRVRPFRLGNSGRLAAHALLYVPSPSNIVVQPGYGRQPLWYCKNGCCHGPHMHEEWWVGPEDADPTKMTEWRRPFFDTKAFPHDIWAMAQPVLFNNSHLWVDNRMYALQEHRMSGIFSSSNAEFSTKPFAMPSNGLWVNAAALWYGGNHVGDPEGCDEGCAAYLMAELLDAETGAVIPGYDRTNCVVLNKDGLQLPLEWNTTQPAPDVGALIQVRFFFRDATIYAVGGFDETSAVAI